MVEKGNKMTKGRQMLISALALNIPEWSTECQPKKAQEGDYAANDGMLEDFNPLKTKDKQMKSGCCFQNMYIFNLCYFQNWHWSVICFKVLHLTAGLHDYTKPS